MSVRFRVFASGQLHAVYPNSEVLYRVPAGKSAVINSMRFTRHDYYPPPGTLDAFTIALQRGNATWVVFPDGGEALLGWNQMVIEDRDLTLGADEAIVAWVGRSGDPQNSSYADVIDYLICGVERNP